MIACLYDAHGNLPALEAVLADIGDADCWPTDPPEHLREPAGFVRRELGAAATAELAALPETAEDGDTLICHVIARRIERAKMEG